MTFPAAPINVIVQILINGSWCDISQYVYERNDILIKGRGRPNETTSVNPCDMTLTLNNLNGPFSPNNTASPFYPFILQNTQIRILINTQSASGLNYNGYRFWGEVRKWPPNWDLTGNDVWIDITASGILTRYIQGDNIGSPLRRFYTRKNDDTRPIAAWMCEELTGSNQFASAVGGSAMTWTGNPALSSDSSVKGVDPFPQFNGSVWTGNTGSYTKSGPVTFQRAGFYNWICPGAVTSVNAQAWGAGGGGGNGANGDSGGGGEWVGNTAMAVTPGATYLVIVGKGGDGGSGSNSVEIPGGDGGVSWFGGDSAVILAIGGGGGTGSGPGAGGTGGTGITLFNGGNGAVGAANGGGGGGGGSAGSTGAGGNGQPGSGTHGGASGAAGAGGGAVGGTGESTTQLAPGPVLQAIPGRAPGGGGGGGSWNGIFQPVRGPGSSGAPGKVTLNFTQTTVPNDIVIRFLVNVPKSGMPDGAVIIRGIVASGTLAKVEGYYSQGFNGGIGFRGYDGANTKIFDTSRAFFAVNGAGAFLVSLELRKSGSNVSCTTNVVQVATGTTQTTPAVTFAGTMGAINQIIANPNGNIQDTSCGSIVLQYAFEPFYPNVAIAAYGHNGEMAVDRFARLCSEEGVSVAIQADGYWTFGDGTTDGWTTTNASINPNFTYWSTVGTNSLLVNITTANAVYSTTSPLLPCVANQSVSVRADVNSLGFPGPFEIDITYYDSNKTVISTSTSPVGTSHVVNQQFQVTNLYNPIASGTNPNVAPANTAFVSVTIKSNSTTSPAGAEFAIDNVSLAVGGWMGPQLDRTFMELIQEVEDFDRGLIVEARDFFGIKYRTRASLQNQPIGLTLDYNNSDLAQIAQPVFDEQLVRNNVTITRTNGSTDIDTLTSGPLSIQQPPDGIGNYPYSDTVNCFADYQLNNLTDWILTVGTVNDYRFPSIIVDLARASVQNRPFLDIADGTFESGVSSWAVTQGTVAQSSVQKHSGSFSALCTVVGTPAQLTLRPIAADYIPISGGSAYQTTMWVFPVTGTSSFYAAIDWYDTNKVYMSTSKVTFTPTAGRWNQITVTDYAPTTAAFASYGPSLLSPAAGQQVYVDDAHLVYPSGQPFTATPTIDCGDRLQIANMPSWLPNPNTDQLISSFDEAINAFKWTITMSGVPEAPYSGSGFPTW